MFKGLFRGEDLNEAFGEAVKIVGMGQMEVERGGVKLGNDVYLLEIGVDAVGDGNIYKAEFAPEWDRGFGPFLG
jgi:hypothetical protein